MGYRFRKSINLGLGFRINLSKSGIGMSWGVPGYRKTWKANGGTRTTYSIPGTGISYVEETNKKQKNIITHDSQNMRKTILPNAVCNFENTNDNYFVIIPKNTKRFQLRKIFYHPQYNSSTTEKTILSRFSENTNLLHKEFLPIISLFLDIGISVNDLLKLIIKAYDSVELTDLSLSAFNAFIFEETSFRIKVNNKKLLSIIPDDVFVKNLVELYTNTLSTDLLLIWLHNKEFKKKLLTTTKRLLKYPILNNFVLSSLEYQAFISFFKIFYYYKLSEKVERNETSREILVKAITTLKDIDLIASRTYKDLRQILAVSVTNFNYDNYKSFIIIYVVLKQYCSDYMSKNQYEQLENADAELITNKINNILRNKRQKAYDVPKLLLGMLYENAYTYNTLKEFINDWLKINKNFKNRS